jgi:hypothetical protein
MDLVPGRAGTAVIDPYYGTDEDFAEAWDDVSLAARGSWRACRASAAPALSRDFAILLDLHRDRPKAAPMPARIYQRPKNAMQSGKARIADWLEFAPAEAKRPDPLMGWAGSGDTQQQVVLKFASRPTRSPMPKSTASRCTSRHAGPSPQDPELRRQFPLI